MNGTETKTFRVYFTTGASASVTVTVQAAEDAEETREAAIEAAYEVMSGQYLCAQCGGWGKQYSMDLGEWEIDDADSEAVTEVSA